MREAPQRFAGEDNTQMTQRATTLALKSIAVVALAAAAAV